MSHTGRAVFAAIFEPSRMTEAQRAFAERSKCPSDAPTDREWREHRDATTITADEWKRYAKN